MGGTRTHGDQRGGGDRSRTDDFRFAPGGSGKLASAGIGGLGLAAILMAVFDAGGARKDAIWVVPAGLFLILVMAMLFWVTRRRPVLLRVGPDGLDLPAAFARPLAWGEIWRMRRTRRKQWLQPAFIMLRADFAPGIRPVYKRRLWTMPALDAWIAGKWGLRIPIHNLDADEEVILASVERFKPVQRVAT